jgi:hypothetical protein
VNTEFVDVSAQGLTRRALARHRAPKRQHLLAGAKTERDAASAGHGLERPQRARLWALGIWLGQVGLTNVLDQHGYHFDAQPRGQKHELSGLWIDERELYSLLMAHQLLA